MHVTIFGYRWLLWVSGLLLKAMVLLVHLPSFEREIVNSLVLIHPTVVRQQLNRPNICISVRKKTVSL